MFLFVGVPPSLKKDQFSDLLNVDFGKGNQGPRSLKDMKKQTDIETAIDPDRARVGHRNFNVCVQVDVI